MNFLTSLKSVGILMAMAIPGFIAVKSKLLKQESAVKVLSVILLYICQPFIMINSFLSTDFRPDILLNAAVIMLITSILIIIMLLIAKSLFCFDQLKSKQDIAVFTSAFGNMGFMCIPFLQVLGGSAEVILYASTALVAFNLISWTIGSYIMTSEKKFISVKKALFNVPTLSFILILPLFALNINFNHFPMPTVQNAVAMFSNLTAPLSMLMLGMRAAEMRPKELFLSWRAYAASGLKLLVQPCLAFILFVLCSLFMDTDVIRLNIIALAAMPAASNAMMFASIYKKDTGAAAATVVLSNFLSILTIPIMLFLFAG